MERIGSNNGKKDFESLQEFMHTGHGFSHSYVLECWNAFFQYSSLTRQSFQSFHHPTSSLIPSSELFQGLFRQRPFGPLLELIPRGISVSTPERTNLGVGSWMGWIAFSSRMNEGRNLNKTILGGTIDMAAAAAVARKITANYLRRFAFTQFRN